MDIFWKGDSLTQICVLGLGLLLGGGANVWAQSGPGGVGTTDGSSSLELWLRADEGVSGSSPITSWADQSGNGRDASANGDPQLSTSTNSINGKPAVSFDGVDDGFSISTSNNDALESLAGSANTVFVVSKRSGGGSSTEQYIFSVRGDQRLLAYDLEEGNNTFGFVGYNKSAGATIDPTRSGYEIGSSLFLGGSGTNIDAVFGAGNASATGSAQTGNSGEVYLGQNGKRNNVPYLNGDVAEVIAYSRALNAAEIRIVLNYLAAKYDRSLNSTYDFYDFGSYPNAVVGLGDASSGSAPGGASGPGVATSGSQNNAVESSILTLDGTLTDAFVLFGHDGDSATTFASSGNPPNAKRLERQWRVDLEGTSSASFSASVDLTSVSLGSGFNDFGLFVDSDGDFTTTDDQTFYDLEDGDGDDIYDASGVSIGDGDRVAIAQINRTVSFSTTSGSEFENVEGSPNASVTATVNYVDGSNIDVSFIDTGDLDESGCFEDGQTDEDPNTSCDTSNDDGNFEADDGSGDDDGTGNEGNFAGDYRVNTGSPVTISGGSSSTTLNIELDNDGLQEQSEKFEVNLDSISTGKATLGSSTTFTFTILDDDEERNVKFADSDYTDGDDDPTYDPNSTEGDGGSSRVEKFTVKLREDGDGESAAGTSPYTKVDFTVDGSSTANFGTDLSNPLVDVRIKNETGSDGTEYQERLSATSGRIYFASGASSSTLKLEINEDGLEDADTEDIVLNLINPVSSALVENDSTQTTFQISDDDTPPNVSFTSSNFSGDEGTDAQLNVELDQQAGTDLAVSFQDDGSGSATDPDDYDFDSSGNTSITIPAGNTSGTFTFSLVDDSENESNETIDASIASSGTDASLGSPTSATYTIIDDEGIGSTGPGGVGSTDGSGNLSLWLNVETGVFSGSDCSGSISDQTGVGCWQDQSGHGNNATQGTADSEPTYRTRQQNGYPVLRFDGTDDVLSHSLTSIGTGNNTVFVLSQTNSTNSQQGIFAVAPDVNGGGNGTLVTSRTVRFASSDAAEGINGGADTPNPATGGTPGMNPVILSSTYTDSSSTVDIGVNGSQEATNSSASTQTGSEGRIGSEMEVDNNSNFTSVNFLDGDVGEVIAYETDLNTAQRNIVRNYLSAKYNVPLAANDLYAGDTDTGQFDHHVIGIGQEGQDDASDAHTRAEGGGLTLSASSMANGPDYVLIGHQSENLSSNHLNYAGTDGVGGSLQVRPDSIQFLSVSGSPSFNLTYDLSEIGLKAKAGDASGYVLLTAPTSCTPSSNDCTWSDAGGSVSVSGDEITFSDVSVSSGDYYLSIGTTDEINSPLLHTWARTVSGENGTDGADAGWRHVGVPVQGALIDHLQPPVSPSRDGFVTHWVAMDYHWSLDEGGSNTDGWTELQSGDQVPNGRGFNLYLYDDEYYPIDTEIPLDVERNDGPPGATDVTVGDNDPTFDTPLSRDNTLYLLANPYATSFDLTGNLSGPSGSDLSTSGFQSTIQIWDTYKDSYVTKTQGTSGDEIAEWQAFFVERSTTGAGDTELTFDASGRDAGPVDFMGSKSDAAVQTREIGLRLRAHRDEGEDLQDEAVGLLFSEGAASSWDRYDASKLVPFSHEYAALYAVGTGADSTMVPKALESRSHTPDGSFAVPLKLEVEGLYGEMTVEVREWAGIPDDWSVTLVDTKENEEIPFGPEASYTFEYTNSEEGHSAKAREVKSDSLQVPPLQVMELPESEAATSEKAGDTAKRSGVPDARFQLRVDPVSKGVPHDVARLDATETSEGIVLEWATNGDRETEGFYVEHQQLALGDSTEEIQEGSWKERSFITSTEKTDTPQEYQHRVSSLDYGRHVFRLRQVGPEGEVGVTDPVEAQILLDESHEVSAPYPNPVQQQATLEVTVQESQPVQIEVYDVLGRRIRSIKEDKLSSQQTRRVQIQARNLSSGHYFVRVLGENFQETRRLTVVR